MQPPGAPHKRADSRSALHVLPHHSGQMIFCGLNLNLYWLIAT